MTLTYQEPVNDFQDSYGHSPSYSYIFSFLVRQLDVAPPNVNVDISSDGLGDILVTWEMMYGITQYHIQYMAHSNTVDRIITGANSYRIKYMQRSTKYSIRVAGLTDSGRGIFSEYVYYTSSTHSMLD